MAYLRSKIMEEHRASMQTFYKIQKEMLRSEQRMAIIQQSMLMDIWDIQDQLAERQELIQVKSGNKSDQENFLAETQFHDDSTKPTTVEESDEDGSSTDEFVVASRDEEATLTAPIMVVSEDLGHKLIEHSEAALVLSETALLKDFPSEPVVAGKIFAEKDSIFIRNTLRVVRQHHSMFNPDMKLKSQLNNSIAQSSKHSSSVEDRLRIWLDDESMIGSLKSRLLES